MWLIGFIFSIDPIMGVPTSLFLGKYMNIIGRKFLLAFGMILGSFGLILIALVEPSSNESALSLSISSRILAGIGAGCSMTAGPAILISENPNQVDKVISYFEAASGMGLMLGPLLGSLFYMFEIFPSLICTAGIYLIIALLAYFCISDLSIKETKTESLPLLEFICKPVIF